MGDEVIEELFVLVSDTGLDRVLVIIAPQDLRTGPVDRGEVVGSVPWSKELYRRLAGELRGFKRGSPGSP